MSDFNQEEKEIIINSLIYLGVDKKSIGDIKNKLNSGEDTDKVIEDITTLVEARRKDLEQEEVKGEKEYQAELDKINEEELLLEKDFDKYYDDTFGTEEEFAKLDDRENDKVMKKIDQIYNVVINKLNEYRNSKTDEEIKQIKDKLGLS